MNPGLIKPLRRVSKRLVSRHNNWTIWTMYCVINCVALVPWTTLYRLTISMCINLYSFYEVITGKILLINPNPNSNLRLNDTGLCEHIEKELPWSVMLKTRSTWTTPSLSAQDDLTIQWINYQYQELNLRSYERSISRRSPLYLFATGSILVCDFLMLNLSLCM